MLFALLFLHALLWPTASWVATSAPAGRHPSDAPDVDVRIRIERDEVRYDVAMNLGFVDAVLDYPREIEEELHEVEYEGLRYAMEQFLRRSHEVRADGVTITPSVVDFAVEQADMSLLPLFPRLGTKALIKARIVLVYSLKSEPQRIELGWGAYPPDELMQLEDMPAPPMTVRAVLSVMGDDRRLEFTPARPVWVWKRTEDAFTPRFESVPPTPQSRTWTLPLASVLCGLLALLCLAARRPLLLRVGPALGLAAIGIALRGHVRVDVPLPFAEAAPLPDAAQARAIFEPLHANIYRAFDYTKEGDIYDALARSVAGDYLEQLYRQVYESLVLRDEGGAMSRVLSVAPLDFRLLASRRAEARPELEVEARWRVKGAVFHWGHDHVRVHDYDARYVVVATEDGWRIAEHEVLAQERKPRLESIEQEIPAATRDDEDR